MDEALSHAIVRDPVQALLNPKSIAIIGASGQGTGLSSRPLEILQEHGFPGQIYVVNPNRDVVGGLPAYEEVGAIADDVDLALVCVPGKSVPGVIEECGRKGIRTAYVLTSGFEGQSPEGSKLAQKIADVVGADDGDRE